MDPDSVCITQFVNAGASCQPPAGIYYFPSFQANGIEVNFSCKHTVATPDQIGQLSCRECKNKAQGFIPSSLCFGCAKKKKVELPLKPGSTIDQCQPRAKKENRKGIAVYGPIIADHAYLCAASTYVNEYKSLVSRQCAPTPKADAKLWAEVKAWVIDGFEDLFPAFPQGTCCAGDLDPMFEDWNAHFPKAVRTANVKAWDKLKKSTFDVRLLKRWLTIKLFLKLEKYDKALVGMTDPSLAPRCISSFRPEVNVATGPPIRQLQSYFHRAWGDYQFSGSGVRGVCFPAGMNAEQLGEYFSNALRKVGASGYTAWEDDFTLYDSTHSEHSHDFLCWLYDKSGAFANWPWFEAVRRAQGGRCRGKTRHGLVFTEVSTMKSGAADTCLGNTIINFVLHLFAIAKLNGGLSARAVLARTMMAVLGDDNVTFADPLLDLSGVPAVLNSLGFICKWKQRHNPSEVVFLNNQLFEHTPGKYIAVPNFFRLISKIGYAVESQPDPGAYVAGVAQAFSKSFSGITLCSTFIEHLKHVAGSRFSLANLRPDGTKVNKLRTFAREKIHKALEYQYKIWANVELEPTPLSDQSFRDRWMITKQDEEHLIKVLTSFDRVPCAISDPLLSALVGTALG